MSDCNAPPARSEACNCCNDSAIQQRLAEILHLQQTQQSALQQLQQLYQQLPPTPTYRSCTGDEPLASNARVAQCADIDHIRNDLDNLHQQMRYRLLDCSGVALATDSRVASCDDLADVDARIDTLVKQYTNLQQEVNRVREIAEAAKHAVDAVKLTSHIDASTLQGITDRMKGLEERISNVAATADAASAGVDVLNAKPKSKD